MKVLLRLELSYNTYNVNAFLNLLEGRFSFHHYRLFPNKSSTCYISSLNMWASGDMTAYREVVSLLRHHWPLQPVIT